MPRRYSDIPKFKNIELSLRRITVSCSETIKKIDVTLSGKRNEQEITLLNGIREECVELLKKGKNLIFDLHEGVDGIKFIRE